MKILFLVLSLILLKSLTAFSQQSPDLWKTGAVTKSGDFILDIVVNKSDSLEAKELFERLGFAAPEQITLIGNTAGAAFHVKGGLGGNGHGVLGYSGKFIFTDSFGKEVSTQLRVVGNSDESRFDSNSVFSGMIHSADTFENFKVASDTEIQKIFNLIRTGVIPIETLANKRKSNFILHDTAKNSFYQLSSSLQFDTSKHPRTASDFYDGLNAFKKDFQLLVRDSDGNHLIDTSDPSKIVTTTEMATFDHYPNMLIIDLPNNEILVIPNIHKSTRAEYPDILQEYIKEKYGLDEASKEAFDFPTIINLHDHSVRHLLPVENSLNMYNTIFKHHGPYAAISTGRGIDVYGKAQEEPLKLAVKSQSKELVPTGPTAHLVTQPLKDLPRDFEQDFQLRSHALHTQILKFGSILWEFTMHKNGTVTAKNLATGETKQIGMDYGERAVINAGRSGSYTIEIAYPKNKAKIFYKKNDLAIFSSSTKGFEEKMCAALFH